MPVVTGCGGRQPGQILDNFSRRLNRLDTFLSADTRPPQPVWPVERIIPSLRSLPRNRTRRTGSRSREATEKERLELREKTNREIDEIVAEFHARLPRHEAMNIGAVYVRYSTRFQDSAADQVRTILEEALRLGCFVPREYVFFDLAVRGCKNHRLGLDELQEVLRTRKVGVVLFFATNRLFRKVFRTLEFVEKVVKQWGIRCIFCKSGVDTNDAKQWEMLLQVHSLMDQFVVSMYADNVRAAQQGLFEKGLVFGTITFGYAGEPIEGRVTKRGRPRCRLAIDPVAARVVERIFQWYVQGHRPIDQIVRLLNADPEVPLTPRCNSGTWSHAAVRKILTNTRYRGLWRYGVLESIWISEKDYSRGIARSEPLKEIQSEELRIISDDLWFAAQKRLIEEPRSRGRRPKDSSRALRPKLLNGLFVCPEHNRSLMVDGAYGETMFCPTCKRLKVEDQPLYSKLNRRRALGMTCQRLAALVQQDEQLVLDVIAACQREAEAMQRTDPARLAQLKDQVEKLSRAIQANMRNRGDTEEDQAETDILIRQLRQERSQVMTEISALEAVNQRQIKVPSEVEVRELLQHFSQILMAAASGKMDENFGDARDIVSLLVGGRIELYQQGERKAQRGWLQGRFKVRLLSTLVQRSIGQKIDISDDGIDVAIDYRRSFSYGADADRAKEMYDQGLLAEEIAEHLHCGTPKVIKLLTHWYASHEQAKPDFRARAQTIRNKRSKPPRYEQIANEVKFHWDQGISALKIAKSLDTSAYTVMRAIKFWHRTNGLPVPTDQSRRRERLEQVRQMLDQGWQLKQIALELGYSNSGIRRMLREGSPRRITSCPTTALASTE